MQNSRQPLITEISKSDFSKIVLSIDNFKDKIFLNIRTHFKNDAGNFVPSQKGITVPLDKIDELITALEKIKNGSIK